MPVPTIDEAKIYKSPYKLFDTRVMIRLDRPAFTSPFIDHFDAPVLNEELWHKSVPSWTHATIAGSTIKLGSDIPSICPSYISSAEGMAFPNNTDTNWVHEVRLRFPTQTGFGAFYRVMTLDDSEAIFSIKCNAAPDGLTVEFRDGSPGVIRYGPGYSTAWLRVKLEYFAFPKTYRLTVDADDDGVFELGPWTLSANNLYADTVVIGNSVARQPHLGDWTEIEVDYVETQGTSEHYEIPDWAGPMYLYSSLAYANQVWAELPAVLGGSITVNKRNITDVLDLDLVNFSLQDPSSPLYRIYTDFDFFNRGVNVLSRVSDGLNWTPMRTIYRGTFDEKQVETSGGETKLTVNARDTIRRRLDRHHIIAAFSDWGLAVPGLWMNKTVQQIIELIVHEFAGFPPTAVSVQETPHNTPRNFTISGESLASAIVKLMEDVGFCWWIRLSDGQVQVRDWYWGDGVPDYQMSTGEDITSLSWSKGISQIVGSVELTIENTNAASGGFSTNYPHVAFPFYGSVSYMTAVTAQAATDLYTAQGGRRLDYLRWKKENREVGGITIQGSCQDWVEHDIQIAVRDNTYLGINPKKHGIFVVDGWRHQWQGKTQFDTEINLVPERPQDIIRALKPDVIM